MPFAKSVWHDKSLNHLPFPRKNRFLQRVTAAFFNRNIKNRAPGSGSFYTGKIRVRGSFILGTQEQFNPIPARLCTIDSKCLSA